MNNGKDIRSSITILYVEDDQATREQVARALQTRGYLVTSARDGQEGVELFAKETPDIVLTDIMMPRLGGLEMAQQIRSQSPDALIVCMTAFSDTNYMIEAIEIGINQFVLKPVEFHRLFSALERCQETVLLRRHQQRRDEEKHRAEKMEAIAILAGGMAHDFNNLLQVILGYASLARLNAEPGSTTESMLAIVEKSAENAQALGGRLLTFARGGDLFKKSLQPAQLVKLQTAASLSGVETITASFDLPDDLPLIIGDGTQLRQVVHNLLQNACEAMPDGGQLHIQGGCETLGDGNDFGLAAGDYLHLQFADTGTGIPAEHLPKIFDPYFSTKQIGATKGTGLGLALCSSIIKHHDGHIYAESAYGKGACFHIYLPVSSTT